MKVDSLTRRERQIACAYAAGATHRDIAERLFISPATVRTHLSAIYRKLGVASKIKLLKELERMAVGEVGPPLEGLYPKAGPVAMDARDPSWALAEADLGAAGHKLSARVSRLHEGTRAALASGLFEREQVHPGLGAGEVQFRAVIEALPAVILLKDQALRYVFANRFFLGQWGLCPENVVGRTQQEVFSGGLGFAWSRATDDRDARVLHTGHGTGFYVVRVPVGAAHDRVLWARKLPLRNEEGSISHVLTVGIDITGLERGPDEMSGRLPLADMPPPRSTAQARILIADAEPEVRQLAIEALERIGHTVETAASGREALAVLGRQPVDLVVSDIMMTDLDGPGLHHVLAARRPELLERLIFTTQGNVSAELESFVRETGLEVLKKPFTAQDIVARSEARLVGTTSDARA